LPHPLSAQKLISATYLFPIFSSFWVIKKGFGFLVLMRVDLFSHQTKKIWMSKEWHSPLSSRNKLLWNAFIRCITFSENYLNLKRTKFFSVQHLFIRTFVKTI
jgi:hypothetical protein